jgi:Cu(I)/Ag(I) efflux system membrane fusion protein
MRAWLLIALPLLALACARSSSAPPAAAERKPLFYRNPMNPQDTSPVPKQDSMGMDYVPVYAEAPSGPRAPAGMSAVAIDATQQHLIGLKTAIATRAPFATSIRTTGRVAFDETRLVQVQPRFEGFVEKLYASYSGKHVDKGEPLAAIYSPELLATEEELLLARRAEGTLSASGLPDAADAARARLRLFGISDAEIARIEASGKPVRALPLLSPISGFVIAKNVVQGARVGASDALFELADLSVVWVLADVYEYELPRLALGQKATLTLSYWPDKIWRGRVGFVSPTVDDKTRTIRVRIEVANPRTELKPEMFADVSIAAPPRRALVVPEDAIIDTGTRKVVFVVLGAGKLAPREVRTGDSANGVVEIRSGLAEGDVVATSANFLLDSESRLASAVSAMGPAGDGGSP